MEPSVAAQLTEVRERLDRALAANAPTATIFGDAGQAYHAYAVVDAAEACYRNAQSLDPSDFRWPYLLGILQQDDGRLDEAATSFARALSGPNQYYPAWIRLATVHVALGRLDDAAAALERVRAHAPDDPARLVVEGELDLARRQYDAALKALTRALELQPRASRLHYLIGMAHRNLGHLDEARAHLDLAGPIGVRPRDQILEEVQNLRQGANAFMIEGHLAFRAGDYAGAAAAFGRAAEFTGETEPAALVNLAAAEAMLGRRNDAEGHLRRVLALDRNHVGALFNLGTLLASVGDHTAAEPLFRRAVALAPSDGGARLGLGLSLAALGRHAAALAALAAAGEIPRDRCADTLKALEAMTALPDPDTRRRAAALGQRLRSAGPCAK